LSCKTVHGKKLQATARYRPNSTRPSPRAYANNGEALATSKGVTPAHRFLWNFLASIDCACPSGKASAVSSVSPPRAMLILLPFSGCLVITGKGGAHLQYAVNVVL
jgi:hypothetical protein